MCSWQYIVIFPRMNTASKAWTLNILPPTFLLQENPNDPSSFSFGNLTWKTKPTQLALLFKLKLLLNKMSTHNCVWKRMTWRLMVVLTSRYYLYQIVWHPSIWNMTLMVLSNWIEDELAGPKFCTSHYKATRILVILNHRSISLYIFGENSPFCIA